MDANRFDRIVQSFATVGTRRGVARLLGALPVAGLLATFGEASVAGRRHGHRRRADGREQVHDQRKDTRKKRKKRKKKCAKIAQTPRKGKPCCKGLVRDGAGLCAGRCDVCPSGCQFASVQAAIAAAPAGNTITICPGTYVENIAFAKNLTLIGAGDGADPAANTVLRGTGSGRVVDIGDLAAAVTLQSLRITGGSTTETENGGGIRKGVGQVTLADCTITGNSAANGAGIANGGGTVIMSGCTISVNTGTGGNGGGIANIGGNVTLSDCVVTGNTTTGQGGGIISGSSTATLTLVSSSVTGNHAGSDGGGIMNFGTVGCSGDSTVSANTAGDPPVTSNCVGGTGCGTCTL